MMMSSKKKNTTFEDERHWIPPERLRPSGMGFYQYIGAIEAFWGEFRAFAYADGPGSVFILAASLPQKLHGWTQGAGFLSDAGNGPFADERGSGRLLQLLYCVLITILFLPVSLRLSN